MFPIENGLKRGDALLPFLFNFVLEYAIRRVKVIQDDLKLNGKQQIFVSADDINIMRGSVHTIKKNRYILIIVSKETGLEVNSDITRYMVVSPDQMRDEVKA
jgi:hypothetical protein